MLRCGFLSSAKFVVHCRAFLEPAQHAALFSVIRHGLQICKGCLRRSVDGKGSYFDSNSCVFWTSDDCALEVSRLLGSLGDIPFPLDVEVPSFR